MHPIIPLRFRPDALASPMATTLTLELPEAVTAELEAAVEAGWFANQAEVVRAAVLDFVSHGKLALLERHQLEDIDWAVKVAEKNS